MGSGQSARKLTVVNGEDLDVITVSNAVVQRLAHGSNESKAQTTPEVRSDKSSQTSANKVIPSQLPASGNVELQPNYNQVTISALKMQQQKENELLNQEQYWQKRVEDLEKHHHKINRIIEEEYKKASKELYVNGDKKVNVQDSVQPCVDSSDKVLKCFQEHPKEILKCSSLVEEFSNCVNVRRAQVIAARC